MKEIVIANMMRTKNKQSFFALHQIQSKIQAIDPDIKIEFHILWDNKDEYGSADNEKWSKLIDSEIKNVHSYSRSFFVDYVKRLYKLDYTNLFETWPPIYHMLIAHYLRRALCKDYYLIYDDDILINDDFKHITDLIVDHVPVLIAEPMNSNCDKALFPRLLNLYGDDFYHNYKHRNPNLQGFNAGFQGIDLSMYDEYLSVDRFKLMLDLFEYKSVLDKDGKEFFGPERFLIDTQQQSFFGLMNVTLSQKNPHILDPNLYYVIPNFGHHPVFGELSPDQEMGGWKPALQSRVTHFIGHTQGKGKPKVFLDKVDEYLITNSFL
jgi:hypothetical protein